jgi:predicted RND superfamily exporter protein
MRTDNRNVRTTVISIYFVLIVLAVLLATVFKSLEIFVESNLFVFLGCFIILIIFHYIARHFEYDSDGDKMILLNQGLILTDYLNYRKHRLEFSKEQLIGFKIKNFIIYKSLVIVIKNQDGKTIKERFNVTLVKRRSLKYVRQSLNKTIKLNRKQKQG